ncbi:MAG: hypothetical protein E6R05_03025 [Candidatus Moraniibacteriota bacterium]|nr:MAG: hypothetical protein E6R05_03025 [Candidatus Moranbacteria bacterium]
MGLSIDEYRKVPKTILRDQLWYQYEAIGVGIITFSAIILGYPALLIFGGGVLIDGFRHAKKGENLKQQYKKGVRVSSRNM